MGIRSGFARYSDGSIFRLLLRLKSLLFLLMIVFHRKYMSVTDFSYARMVGFYSSSYNEWGFSAVSDDHLGIIDLNYRANACCENSTFCSLLLSDSSYFCVQLEIMRVIGCKYIGVQPVSCFHVDMLW